MNLIFDAHMDIEIKKLVNYIDSIGLKIHGSEPPFKHIGAIIIDATLSARHNYETQVKKRVVNLIDKYPLATTTSAFIQLINDIGLEQILMGWEKNIEEEKKFKQIQVRETAEYFARIQPKPIETFLDLTKWIEKQDNRQKLKKSVYGIGDKTADYYAVLVRDPQAIAVDERISIFLENAGIDPSKYSYKKKQTIVRQAAKIKGYIPLDLEQTIWRLNLKRGEKGGNMEDNDKELKLTILLPQQRLTQLENISKKEFGVSGTTLARIWVIEMLRTFDIPQNLIGRPVASIRTKTSQILKAPTPLIVANTNRKKIRGVIENKWDFGESFSRKELVRAVQEVYKDMDQNVILPADRAINQISGYHKKGDAWEKQEPYLFKLSNGKFERYEPSRHGGYECTDDADGNKIIKKTFDADLPQIQ